MTTTPNLVLPYLAAGQAQKHVTLNESLRMLDAIVQLSVTSRVLAAPPANPAEGERYIVAAGGAGVWSGHAGKIAAFQDGGWMLYAPKEGWLAWVRDEDKLCAFDGAAWVTAGGGAQNQPLVGVNATADTTNRLAVSAPATLLNHEGAGHQLKVNKAAAAQTASLLFQTGFSGRAEMGTAGDDVFRLKTSPDGSNWTQSISAHPVSGVMVGPHLVSTATTSGGPTLEACLDIPGDRFAYFDLHASDAQPDYSARLNRTPGVNGDLVLENIGAGHLRLSVSTGTVRFNTGGIDRLAVDAAGHLVPIADNAYQLGSSGARFSAIWAANGVIQTSDSRDKLIEQDLPAESAAAMIDAVSPILFRWKSGSRDILVKARHKASMNPENPCAKSVEIVEAETVDRPGKRVHAGFSAQTIKAALDHAGLECGVWGLEDPANAESRQWIRPDQLIPVLWAALRQTRAEIRDVKADIKALEGRKNR